MNSVRIVPVNLKLIKEALEHYWRYNGLIQERDNVKIVFDGYLDNLDLKATLIKEELLVYRDDG